LSANGEDFSGYSALDLRIDPSCVSPDLSSDAAPLRRVWAMVLTVAVVDYLVAKPTSKRFRNAKDWIFYGQSAVANSFDNVARFLDFEPGRLRGVIACRRSEAWADPAKALLVLAELRSAKGGALPDVEEA
jgi:hypothetical protein